MAIRAPFLYAGYFCWDKNSVMTEYSYTDAQLQGLGGATEFVVTSGNFQNYFDATGAPDSYYLQVYVDRAVKLANRLYNMYGKKVWIGTPTVGLQNVVPHTATVYAEVARRMTYFVDNVMVAFGGEAVFKSRVKGFYMSVEEVYDTFSSISTHPQVSMFQTVSNYVARFGMQMMWSPWWGTRNLENAAQIIHRTNIFDYVFVQPNYYFRDKLPFNFKENCEAVREAVRTQKLCYQNKLQIIPNAQITCHRAKIGCQMEIDSNCVEAADRLRYQYYVDVFGGSTKAGTNFGFYFGCPVSASDTGYNAAKAEVSSFFS